ALGFSRAWRFGRFALHGHVAKDRRSRDHRCARRVHACAAGRDPAAGQSGGRVGEAKMISIACVQRTAEELMAKAAIEIPQDYLAGLRKCADTEKGDLSAFVIKAMLDNYDPPNEYPPPLFA